MAYYNQIHAGLYHIAAPAAYNKEEIMKKYVCTVCGYVYDEEQGAPEAGIAPGTKWEDVPEDFACPLCSVGKDLFEPAE